MGLLANHVILIKELGEAKAVRLESFLFHVISWTSRDWKVRKTP